MQFVELQLAFADADSETFAIATAILSQYNFDTFSETENSLSAFATSDLEGNRWIQQAIDELEEIIAFDSANIFYHEKENWNQEWEKNYFQPISIENNIYVRANFHPPPSQPFVYELIIAPQMSFGTGHHQTTYNMMKILLENKTKIEGKTVIDMGSGSGILAILASKLGATLSYAIDIEDWAAENAKENAALNHCDNIICLIGDAAILADKDLPKAEFFLANIQKNVLMSDISYYSNKVTPNGYLAVSGFFEPDLNDIVKEFAMHGFQLLMYKTKDNWCAALFKKS